MNEVHNNKLIRTILVCVIYSKTEEPFQQVIKSVNSNLLGQTKI
jgi:hypothetical protein